MNPIEYTKEVIAKEKKKAAMLSIASNTYLIIAKLFTGILTGSVSIISEAVHSLSDLLASVIAFFSVKIASEPADAKHQFGHGKFEDLSGLAEGFLIFLAACFIIYEASNKLLHGPDMHLETSAGIIVMLVSVLVNYFVSSHLFKIGKKTESIALIADAEHLRTDIWTSAGVLIALIAIKITGLTIIDPIIAILVTVFIFKTAVSLCYKALNNLLDSSLPEEEKIIIRKSIKKYIPEQITEIQEIKTRRAGAERIVELTLKVPEHITIKQGHDLCDIIEEDLEKNLGNTLVTIHLEPCGHDCESCKKKVREIC